MSARDDLLMSIATAIRDYRSGAIAPPSPEHVDRWVKQFENEVQLPILTELNYILGHTYINRETVTKFLTSLIINAKLVGAEPCDFWRGVNFLNIQGGGNSQREMLAIFDLFLQQHCGFRVLDCGKDATTFVYIDDAVFTGSRVLRDISSWIQTTAPTKAHVHIITIAYHRGGQHYAEGKIAAAAAAAGKQVTLSWWRCVELEDRRFYINSSDVLRPRSLGADPLVAAYAQGLKYQPTFRTADSIGEHNFFSSENGRALLEQEFLKAGAKIRDMCPLLGKYQRPLGNMVLETLGFGSTIITFRNCPNNAPLAFWAGDPWYPLFPRVNN